MRLTVDHTTTYTYERGASYALLQVRKRPQNLPSQSILSWDLVLDGARKEVSYSDHHGNLVDLVSLEPGAERVAITYKGEVETHDTAGVSGAHNQLIPLWLYERATKLTTPGKEIRALADRFPDASPKDVNILHELMGAIGEAIMYETDTTDAETNAEEALKLGRGVCQDHAHVFIATARLLGFPTRYVSGYLMMMDRVEQEAGHAWAEAWVDGLGWTGFDVSNRICPDARYIRVATGLDYRDAAPVRGLLYGAERENLVVSIQVQQ
ncbi:transglutaminase family protein [Hyphomonas pacifica]|uniref:transglutaminase family protein n=1 Tax=Hyphomonas pacifica TaxID=1280941 RepID=UPI000DC03388|nr:transglutaminase family protein [Hyphomonas pacifica]RAN34631.1 hypothetical protein HY11_14830 [Hyphomonas pacifica]